MLARQNQRSCRQEAELSCWATVTKLVCVQLLHTLATWPPHAALLCAVQQSIDTSSPYQRTDRRTDGRLTDAETLLHMAIKVQTADHLNFLSRSNTLTLRQLGLTLIDFYASLTRLELLTFVATRNLFHSVRIYLNWTIVDRRWTRSRLMSSVWLATDAAVNLIAWFLTYVS